MLADFFNNTITQIILVLLSLSSLIGILDYFGFLPRSIKTWLRLNRTEDTMELLSRFGVDIDRYRRTNQSVSFPKFLTESEIEKNVIEELDKQCKIQQQLVVGHLQRTKLAYYYDVIGKTCDPKFAKYFAEILSTFWAFNCQKPDVIRNPDFDFVVTPKAGSPILGYEFAKLINKPFLLHEHSERFSSKNSDMRCLFNCSEIPIEGSTALIVDDSTTGGTLIVDIVKSLRKYGYQVHTCLVIFEVKVKDAKTKLGNNNVQLVSIVKTHTEQQMP